MAVSYTHLPHRQALAAQCACPPPRVRKTAGRAACAGPVRACRVRLKRTGPSFTRITCSAACKRGAAVLAKAFHQMCIRDRCCGTGVIFQLPYIRNTFYVPLVEALNLTNEEFGLLSTSYATVSMICYFFGGWIADRVSPRKLLTISFISTGLVLSLIHIFLRCMSVFYYAPFCAQPQGGSVTKRRLCFFEAFCMEGWRTVVEYKKYKNTYCILSSPACRRQGDGRGRRHSAVPGPRHTRARPGRAGQTA